jgi:MFS family permease
VSRQLITHNFVKSKIAFDYLPLIAASMGDANTVALSSLSSWSRSPNLERESNGKYEMITVSEGAKVVEIPPEHIQQEYPSGLKLTTIMVGLCLAVFLVALDNTIIVTAIPAITDAFHALSDIGWYGSAYLLTTCAFQLLYGKLYTHFNIKLVFLLAITCFEVGSLICGAAPTSTALIVGRAVAGLGAAGIFSGALIIIAHNVPLVKRPVYSSTVIGMYGIASVAGPLMGGALTDNVSWRWCFYINLPIGGVTIVLITLFLKAPPLERKESSSTTAKFLQFDPVGTVVFIPAIVCLLLALQWGGSTYPWSDGRIIALFVVFGVLIIAFVGIQIWRGEDATVPPRIFMQRSILAGVGFGICLGGAFFLFIYYLPIWFQAVKGTSAIGSGIRCLPLILSQIVGVGVSGGLTTRFGYYTPFMLVATILMAVGSGLLSTLKIDSNTGMWVGYQLIFGFGSGAGFQQPVLAAQTVLNLHDVPIGVAINMFLQLFGGTLFVSVAQNVFTTRLISNVVAKLPQLNPQEVVKTGARELKDLVNTPAEANTLLVAYNGALTHAFEVALVLSCLLIFGAAAMEWKSVKGKKLESVAA